MITESQKNEACILLGKLKLLITESAYLIDLKDLYTAIEGAAAGGGAAGGDPAAGGSAPATSAPSSGAPGGATAGPISSVWYKAKMTSLKTQIQSTLTEIRTQISGNI